jgi:hypothetical protein
MKLLLVALSAWDLGDRHSSSNSTCWTVVIGFLGTARMDEREKIRPARVKDDGRRRDRRFFREEICRTKPIVLLVHCDTFADRLQYRMSLGS